MVRSVLYTPPLLSFVFLGGFSEILFQHELRNDILAARISEPIYVGVGVVDYGLRLVGVVDVMVDFGFQIGVVGGYLNVVIIGYEGAFHEPCFVGWARHNGD